MTIERDILQNLIAWKERTDRKPLILQGARQIGKTTIVRQFGKSCYSFLAEFNFEKDRELRNLFASTKDVRRILGELAYHTSVPLRPGDTLLFFDEIQECPDALNTLKYFDEDAPEYHLIAAGSLLGVALNNSGTGFPVGKVNFLKMHPVTFREFLRSAEPNLYEYAESINSISPVPEIIANKISEQYTRYLLCGGLPYVTWAMLNGEGMARVEEKLDELLQAYSNDFSKHVVSKDIGKIHEIWRSLPSQLSRENKKFTFRTIREGARAREYESALQWLILSGLAHKVILSEKPALPLSFYENPSFFKMYMLDVGLLRKLARLPSEALLSSTELFGEFKGAVAENIVLSSLLAQGYGAPHYWTLQGNKAEVDFLIEDGLRILPVEVKSSTRISGKSFAEYDRRYSPSLRIRFSMKNLRQDGNLLNIPLWLADWTKRLVRLSD